jgi:protein-tyrosine phosphatase
VIEVRDVGGYSTRSGRSVRTSLLYRAHRLDVWTRQNPSALTRLNVRSVYDLRTRTERNLNPLWLPDGVTQIPVDAFGDGETVIRPRGYRQMVSLPCANAAYRNLFADLGRGDRLPAIFHWDSRPEPVAWATAALLMLLGISYEIILRDFLRVNGPSAHGSTQTDLDASLHEMRDKYGTIDRYFGDGLGLGGPSQERLRALLLEQF